MHALTMAFTAQQLGPQSTMPLLCKVGKVPSHGYLNLLETSRNTWIYFRCFMKSKFLYIKKSYKDPWKMAEKEDQIFSHLENNCTGLICGLANILELCSLIEGLQGRL